MRASATFGVLLPLALAAGLAQAAGKYEKRAEVQVRWEPPAGQDGVSFSARVLLKHDVFFGDPLELHLAGKYELGEYAVYKGQRYELGALSAQQRARLTPNTIDICYELTAGDAVIATRCPRLLLSSDMPGSSSWGSFIPGLSAEQAKAQFKAGYQFANVRITAYGGGDLSVLAGLTPSGSAPASPVEPTASAHTPRGTGGLAAQPYVPPPPVPEPGPPPSAPFGLPDGGAPRWPCVNPGFRREGPAGNCARFSSFSQPPSLMTDGTTVRQLGLAVKQLTFEYRREDELVFRAQTHPPLMASMAISGLRSCSEYRVRLRASCEDGSQSPWTDELAVRTACPPPMEVSVRAVSKTSADLGYLVPNEPLCTRHEQWSFEVEVKPHGQGWALRSHSGGPLTLDQLTPGTHHQVRMRTVFPHGARSEWSDIATFRTEN